MGDGDAASAAAGVTVPEARAFDVGIGGLRPRVVAQEVLELPAQRHGVAGKRQDAVRVMRGPGGGDTRPGGPPACASPLGQRRTSRCRCLAGCRQ